MNLNAEAFLAWIGSPYLAAYKKNPSQAVSEGVEKARELSDSERKRMIGVLKNTTIRYRQIGLPWGGGKLPVWAFNTILSGVFMLAGSGPLGSIPFWIIAVFSAWDYWNCGRTIIAQQHLIEALE